MDDNGNTMGIQWEYNGTMVCNHDYNYGGTPKWWAYFMENLSRKMDD